MVVVDPWSWKGISQSDAAGIICISAININWQVNILKYLKYSPPKPTITPRQKHTKSKKQQKHTKKINQQKKNPLNSPRMEHFEELIENICFAVTF